MKVLINGNSVTEVVTNKIIGFKSNDISRIEYEGFLDSEISENEIKKFDKFLGHLKKNKAVYIKVVVFLAVIMNYTCISAISSGLTNPSFNFILKMSASKLISLVSYGCVFMGIKCIENIC